MNDRDAMRLAARRAALHASIREGNAQAAARAAARLRVPGARLTAQELTFARDTRAALGRALIAARLPRPAPPVAPAVEVVRRRRIPWRRLAIALAVISALIFLVLGPGGEPGGKPEGDASAVVPDVTRPQVLAQVSRGRSAITTAPEVVAAAAPSAEPTAVPTEAPSAAPSAGAGGAGGAGGSASGAGGGGGGIGIGTGPGLITLPTPRPAPTPRVPPAGYGRIQIIVLDRQTLRPVPDTCVSFGSLTCTTITAGDKTALSYRTDENGRWSLDVPLGAPTVSYDMLFFKLGYRVDIEKITLRRGGTVLKTVFIVKQG
ncbi:MAG TPA: hypothetical protein VI056_12610 [Candidatus Limnocylindria bacterium]